MKPDNRILTFWRGYKTDHFGMSSGGQTIIEGQPFTYYNYQGEKYGHIPVDVSLEVYEAVKGVP